MEIRHYLLEAKKADTQADKLFADVSTRVGFTALADEWRSLARRAGWDGNPLGPRRAGPPR